MLCTEENRRYRFVGNTKNGGDHCAERGKENTTKSEAKDMKGGGGGGSEVGRGGKERRRKGKETVQLEQREWGTPFLLIRRSIVFHCTRM